MIILIDIDDKIHSYIFSFIASVLIWKTTYIIWHMLTETNLNNRFRSFNGRRAHRAEIGGAASIKVSSFESIESRNDCARRRSEILKQERDRFSVAANQRFLLAKRIARCGRSRGRRPRALPYHRSGTRTRPMGKGARGTEVLELKRT